MAHRKAFRKEQQQQKLSQKQIHERIIKKRLQVNEKEMINILQSMKYLLLEKKNKIDKTIANLTKRKH